MTQPRGTLNVRVVGDVREFGRQVQRDLGKAVAGIKLNLGPLSNQFDKAADAGGKAFADLSKTAGRELSGVEQDVRAAAKQIAESLGRGVSEGGAKAFQSLDDDAKKAFGDVTRIVDRALSQVDREAANQFRDVQHSADVAAEHVGAGFVEASRLAEHAMSGIGAKAAREFHQVEREAAGAGTSMLGSMRRAALGIGAVFAGITIGRFFINAAQDAEDLGSAIDNTTQILKATGNAAKLTGQQIRDLSRGLSVEIGVDSVAVQNAANVLLTFRNVSGETFKSAIHLAADLSSVLGTDLQGATLQLGKALNDPVRGITALSRAGVSFDAAQKKQIKGFVETNQLAKAQAIILEELRKEVGGVAKAGADSTDKLKVAFLDLKREAGASLIGFIDDNAPALIGLLQTLEPAVATFGDLLTTAFSAALPFVEAFATELRDNIADLAPAAKPFADVLSGIFSIIAKLAPLFVQIAQSALPPLAALFHKLASAAAPVLTLFVTLASKLISALVPALGPVSELLLRTATVLSGALLDALPRVANAAVKLTVALLPLVPLAVKMLEAVLPLAPPIIAAAAALAELAGTLAGPLGALARFLEQNAAVTWTLVAAITALWAITNTTKLAIIAATIVGNIWAAATKLWTGATRTFTTAQQSLTKSFTSVSIGLAAAGVAILAWGTQARHTSTDIAGLTEDVKRFVDTGAETATLRDRFGEGAAGVAEFADKLNVATASWHDWSNFLNRSFDDISKSKSAFIDLDTALASLVDGGADADAVFQRLVTTYHLTADQVAQLKSVLPQYTLAAQRAKERTSALGDAQHAAAAGTLAHANSLKELGDALRAQTDPVFAFVRAQRAVADAQHAVNEALKEHGRRSPQYKEAVLDLAEAQLGLADATGEVKGVTDASLLPALKKMRDDGLLSKKAFDELVAAIDASKEAAKRLDGTRIRIHTDLDVSRQLGGGIKRHGGIPLFHSGGVMPGSPGSEGLAMLQAGERIIPVGGMERIVKGFMKVLNDLPFALPRVPHLSQGGLTAGTGLAQLHRSELVLPLEDRRAVDLLARAMQEAQASLRGLGVPTFGDTNVTVLVEIDGQQLEGRIVRVVSERDRNLRRRVKAGGTR